MKPQISSLPKLLPLAMLLLAAGMAHAATPPRVMFVSGIEAQPVLVDLDGKEIPAKKGAVIPPGYSVKVPEGATVQIMTDEKAIVAIRQGSLIKLEKLGDGDAPHVFKLDVGGLRVANSDKKPRRFEVDTPNAKVKFDKGDHETYYFKEGKIKDKWGTFVRGFKDEAVLTTKGGETKVTRDIVAYVPGEKLDVVEKLPRLVRTDRGFADPVSYVPGGKPEAISKIGDNQDKLREGAVPPADPLAGKAPLSRGTLPQPGALPRDLALPVKPVDIAHTLPKLDPLTVSKLSPTTVRDPYLDRQLTIATLPTGEKIAIEITPTTIGVMTTNPTKTGTVNRNELAGKIESGGTVAGGGTGTTGKIGGIEIDRLGQEVQKASICRTCLKKN